MPRVDADELEGLGQNIKTAGSGIAESGGDIVSAWGGLSGIYEAPESETLLAAVNPIGTKGDDIEPAATTTGDALITFAERVRELKPRLSGLRADAVELRTRINTDEDWRKDEELHEEHETLLGDVNAAVAEYQEAERESHTYQCRLDTQRSEAGARPIRQYPRQILGGSRNDFSAPKGN